jgi:iron complex transport system substrate-binding protein
MLPVRVVSLTSSNTEIVAALGLGGALVACDSNSDWPPELVSHLPRLGPDLKIDLDALERLKPDLVLSSLSVPGMERVVDGIEARGLRQITLDPTSWEDVLEDVRRVAQELGVPERGQAVALEMQSRALALRSGLPTFPRPPRVMVEWWPKPVIAAAQQSWVTGMLEALGATNAFARVEQRSSPLTTTDVLEAAPDAITCSWCGVKKLRSEVILNRVGWARVPAISGGMVFAVPESGLGRPGPRLIEGLEALAGVLRSVRV